MWDIHTYPQCPQCSTELKISEHLQKKVTEHPKPYDNGLHYKCFPGLVLQLVCLNSSCHIAVVYLGKWLSKKRRMLRKMHLLDF